MTQVPSAAAKRKACELANALRGDGAWQPSFLLDAMTHPLYALALHLDEVDRVARVIDEHYTADGWHVTSEPRRLLRSLMLPDEPDELIEAFEASTGEGDAPEWAARFRAELSKRGIKLVKE